MNKILSIILVIILSGCASTPKIISSENASSIDYFKETYFNKKNLEPAEGIWILDMEGSGGTYTFAIIKNDTEHFQERDYYISKSGNGIDFRAKNIDSLDNLEKNSIDFYASVRSLYLQDRQLKITNSDSITETQDDSDWEEIEIK